MLSNFLMKVCSAINLSILFLKQLDRSTATLKCDMLWPVKLKWPIFIVVSDVKFVTIHSLSNSLASFSYVNNTRTFSTRTRNGIDGVRWRTWKWSIDMMCLLIRSSNGIVCVDVWTKLAFLLIACSSACWRRGVGHFVRCKLLFKIRWLSVCYYRFLGCDFVECRVTIKYRL